VIELGAGRGPTARVSRMLPLDATEAWPLVADARHHTRWVPLTRVGLDGREGPVPTDAQPQVGDIVMAVSGPGARRGWPGLVDRMRVERYECPLDPVPGVAVFVKLGPVILGTARIEVEPVGPGCSRVTWSESVHLRGIPRAATAWIGAVLLHLMIALVVHRMAREAERLAAARSDGPPERGRPEQTQQIIAGTPIHATNCGHPRNGTH
jgi:hypothetical protein